MQALRYTGNQKKLEVVKLPIPQVQRPDEILVKIAYAGICGTDLHVIQGDFPSNKETFTMGHEFCGVVEQVGCAVKQIKKGDRVAVDPNHGCQSCHFCHSGKPHFCPIGGINNSLGIWRNGGWAEYCVAPVTNVHLLPESVTLEQAALTEPLSCVAHGWDLVSPVTVGQKILVLGAGIIGSLWCAILHLQGHRTVTVAEPNSARLDALKKLDTGYDLITPQQLVKNQESDPNYLFDLIVDCSGNAAAIESAINFLQKGATLCCFGCPSPQSEIKMKPFNIFMKELKIIGVLTNPFSFPKSIGLLEAMGDRYLNYNVIGVKTFSLAEYKTAMELLKKGEVPKAVFKF